MTSCESGIDSAKSVSLAGVVVPPNRVVPRRQRTIPRIFEHLRDITPPFRMAVKSQSPLCCTCHERSLQGRLTSVLRQRLEGASP
jgi:hypothetical protein